LIQNSERKVTVGSVVYLLTCITDAVKNRSRKLEKPHSNVLIFTLPRNGAFCQNSFWILGELIRVAAA